MHNPQGQEETDMDKKMKDQSQNNIPYRRLKPDQPVLQPIEVTLQNYPRKIKINYPRLGQKDLHVAEVFRIYARGSIVPASEKKLNPLQTRIDGKGRVWVDVLMERRKGVKIDELRKTMQVRGKPGRSCFISGRVLVDNLPTLNKMALRLQTARPVASALNNSVKTISANRTLLKNNGFESIDGSGVIIGIIDDGCDFNHVNFKKSGKTRLLYLWDQNGKLGNGKHRPANYNYGIEYDRQQIDQALGNNPGNPYKALDYKPAVNAHGTHVMDIAAGDSPNQEFRGVAPGAELIFVQLGSPTTLKKIAKEEMKTLGSSNYLCDAVKYIFEKADDMGMPAVINISLASNGGSHDGTSLLESLFDEMLETPGRAIVIAAGNDFQKKTHTSGKVSSQENSEIFWVVPKADDPDWKFRQELEIWYPGDKRLTVAVSSPNNTSIQNCKFGETMASSESDITPLWFISNDQARKEIDKDENYIHILVDNGNPGFIGGEWHITLSTQNMPNADGDHEVDYHAWIERNLGRPPTEFADNAVTDFSINGIGNAALPLVVGSFYPSKKSAPSYTPSYFTSAGPSRNPQFPTKPELSAPGENISSAQALAEDLSDETGTSAAAPHVTGIIALMFQQALNQPASKILTMQEIRDILMASVDKNSSPASSGQHDRQLGFGRVNALKALKKIAE